MSKHKNMSTNKKHSQSQKPAVQAPATAQHPALVRAKSLIEKQDYAAAAALLRTASHNYHALDMLAICLMRSGQASEAVSVYRSFAMLPSSVMIRPELSDICKRNFATAMLLKGSPSGALDLLEACRDKTSKRNQQIRAAIKAWSKSLSLWRRFDWSLNRIEPQNCIVPIDFAAGEFEFETTADEQVETVTHPVPVAAQDNEVVPAHAS